MSLNGTNSFEPRDDHEIERLLRAIESDRGGNGAAESESVDAMRRDRSALRSALRADLASPLPALRANQFAEAVRDEIDRSLLADLSTGAPLRSRLPVSMVTPKRRSSLETWAPDGWRPTRWLAIAATVALVGGVAWLAMQRPGSSAGTLAANPSKGPRELPSWATLPPRIEKDSGPSLAKGSNTPPLPSAEGAAPESMFTRDASTALAWAKRGVLAVRITTDSPRRDRERLDSFTQRSDRSARWALSMSVPSGIASIPARPWPINTGLADSTDAGAAPAKHPETATIASFGLTIRPTVDAIDAARAELEQSLAGALVFERVDALAAFAEGPLTEPAPDSAADIVWWKKPASEWSPRLRVPVLVEFGVPERAPASRPGR